MNYSCFVHYFLKFIQKNLEYLIQNATHQAIQISIADILNLLLLYELFMFSQV